MISGGLLLPGLVLGCGSGGTSCFSNTFSLFSDVQKNRADPFSHDAQETQRYSAGHRGAEVFFTAVTGWSPLERSSPVRVSPGSSGWLSPLSFLTDCNQNQQHLHDSVHRETGSAAPSSDHSSLSLSLSQSFMCLKLSS